MQDNIGHFGPSVIGEDQYEEEQELLQQEGGPGSKFGPAVYDHPESEHEEEEPEEGAPTTSTTEEPEGPTPQAADELTMEELPPGYEMDMKGPGYYELRDPDGNKIEGTTASGYFEGKVKTRQAAWEDQLQAESERRREEEAEEGQGSAEEVKQRLEANPDAVDAIMRKEFQRADGPRDEVLRALHEAEQERSDGEPRNEVMSVLSNFLDMDSE